MHQLRGVVDGIQKGNASAVGFVPERLPDGSNVMDQEMSEVPSFSIRAGYSEMIAKLIGAGYLRPDQRRSKCYHQSNRANEAGFKEWKWQCAMIENQRHTHRQDFR